MAQAVRRVAIIGASLAGLRAAETLRSRGYDGALTLVGDERHRPYDRPPLSKQVLHGTWTPEQTFFRQKDGYDPLALDLRLGVRAQSLDPAARSVALSNGETIPYDGLVIATGASARPLPHIAETSHEGSCRSELMRPPRLVRRSGARSLRDR